MIHSLIGEDQIDLTDNIISRHFNQSLSGELFNFNFRPQLPPRNESEQSSDNLCCKDDFSDIQHTNELDQKFNQNQVNNEINENLKSIKQNQKNESSQMNETNQNCVHESNYDSSQHYRLDPKEVIFNRNDKIRELINDCELINNNNVNNFVASSNGDETNRAIKIVSSDRCHCKCHVNCSGHKKNPFHQIIKTNKLLLNSLSKIKLHGGHKSNDKYKDKKSVNSTDNYAIPSLPNGTEDYNTFAPSLSSYSLSSSSSISSQTISASSCSSLQDNQYNYNLSNNSNNSTIQLITRPIRKPPLPPPVQIHKSSFNKPPAKLPSYVEQITDSLDNECTINNDKLTTKEYKRVITKSFENLFGIKVDDNEERSVEPEESIYETIDSDYDDDYECLTKNQDEEDLYQDIELLNGEEDIYESLNLLNNVDNLCRSTEAVYMNNQNDLDRKLSKKQRSLDKKRQIRAEKLRKKFGLTGEEVPLMSGIVKENVKANGLNLALNKDEIVLVLRIERNPPGLWLAKNERGKIGYIDLNLIDVDVELFKNLMNAPDVLKS